MSLTSKNKRIDGVWRVETFSVNGNDSTELYYETTPVGISLYVHKGKKDVYTNYTDNQFWLATTLDNYFESYGNWKFSDDKRKLIIDIYTTEETLPIYFFGKEKHSEWEITRLTCYELWVESIIGNQLLEYKFEKRF